MLCQIEQQHSISSTSVCLYNVLACIKEVPDTNRTVFMKKDVWTKEHASCWFTGIPCFSAL